MKSILAQLVEGQALSAETAEHAFELVMTGQAEPAQTGAMLAMIQQRGVTVEELTGAATVMRRHATKVKVPDGLTAIDTCGTGGDHAGTFNISTAAALVAAGAGRAHGVVVAKHGNRSVTSKSGSSQVLETLGVNLAASPEALTRSLDEAGVCFCFAPAHHPAMKHAGPVRAALGFRTLFNLVGPLTNPAGAKRQVIGVFAPELTEMLGKVLLALGAETAMVVHGQVPSDDGHSVNGLDELSTCGENRVTRLTEGEMQTESIDSAALGLDLGHPSSLKCDGPEASARIITEVLDGAHGPARDIVCLNAAAALVVGGAAADLQAGLGMAQQAVDAGQAKQALATMAKLSQG